MNPPTPFEQALLHLAHFDLQYHRLQSAARAVLDSRWPLSAAQEAVLSDKLDALEKMVEESTPKWGEITTNAAQEDEQIRADLAAQRARDAAGTLDHDNP